MMVKQGILALNIVDLFIKKVKQVMSLHLLAKSRVLHHFRLTKFLENPSPTINLEFKVS